MRFVIIAGMVLVIDVALMPLGPLLLISAGASLTAPIASLFFAIFAENKVQGSAVAKFAGLVGYGIVFGWFVYGWFVYGWFVYGWFVFGWFAAEPLRWLFGLFPPFWISKA